MQIFHTISAYPKPTALAIGNFDGVHMGHQAVIAEAKSKGLVPAVLTFEPHPTRLFKPDSPILRITTIAQRFRLLREAGVEVIFVQRFDETFASTTAETFIERDLIRRYRAQHVIVGEDFAFGHHRKGNVELLRAEGIQVSTLPPVMVQGAPCSSTRIRQAIVGGSIAAANALLGRPFAITARVRQGQQKGHKIGFPTMNLKIHEDLVTPRYGVYAVSVDGQKGVANWGIRPTVTDSKTPWLEVHLPQPRTIPKYDDRVTVEFHRFMRPEQKFENIEALQKQIAADIEGAL